MYAYLYLRNLLNDIQNREEGQDLVEYALLLGLLALAAVVAITATGTSINALWGRITAVLGGIAP
jgi:pilus assembly protein Flp/PilA